MHLVTYSGYKTVLISVSTHMNEPVCDFSTSNNTNDVLLFQTRGDGLTVQNMGLSALKGTVHPKMKILSSFTQPQVFPNLFECVCSRTQRTIF